MDTNTIFLIIGISLLIVIGVYFLYKKNNKREQVVFWDDNKSTPRNTYLVNKREKHGKEFFYYRNGKINKERNWNNGKLEGVETIYYESGNIYIQKNYINGILDGEYIVFSPKGEVMAKYDYQNGNMISSEEFPIHQHYAQVTFETEPLVGEEELYNFYDIENEYSQIKEEEDTKDEEKKVDGIWSGFKKVGKVVSGYQAYHDRKSAQQIREVCDKLYDEAFKVTNVFRERLDDRISSFGNKRLISLQNTTGKFLHLLKDMGQNNNIREYAVSKGIGFSIDSLEKMERIDMEVSKAIESSAIVGGLGAAAAMGTPTIVTSTVASFASASTGTAIATLKGAAAAMGTPTIVTSTVASFASASTGTAIATLKGAAATNATLAWLGGGSLATGGGGMAAGAAVLTGIKVAATGGVALIASGLLASTYYSKKLTEVKEKQKAVEIEVNNIKIMWELLESINERTNELKVLTSQLEKRIQTQLEFLYPLSVDFDNKDEYYSKVFQKNGTLIISMNELSQTPLLDKEGNLSSESMNIVEETQKVLNTDL